MANYTSLESLLRREIESQGPISFARFMELALYCPDSGYYERSPTGIGRAGDYYTSVSVGPGFGGLLARQFAQWLPEGSVQLVEAGAHDGSLARDILTWLRDNVPSLFGRLAYWIVEPSPNRQKWQQKRLDEFAGKIRWFGDFPGHVTGVIFSNELLDAFPVRRFGWDGSWFEWGVTVEGDRFAWARLAGDAAPEEL